VHPGIFQSRHIHTAAVLSPLCSPGGGTILGGDLRSLIASIVLHCCELTNVYGTFTIRTTDATCFNITGLSCSEGTYIQHIIHPCQSVKYIYSAYIHCNWTRRLA